MKKLLSIIFLLTLSVSIFGQKTVAELQPKHAIALENFLSKNKNYQFLSERAFYEEYLKEFKEFFGKSTKPYYTVADFNFDGIKDFALILSRKGETTKAEGTEGTPYEYDNSLAVVIFNGNKKGGFTKAFIEDIEAPLVCLIKTEGLGRKLDLFFGVYASDADTRIFTPVGKGYIIEYPEEP